MLMKAKIDKGAINTSVCPSLKSPGFLSYGLRGERGGMKARVQDCWKMLCALGRCCSPSERLVPEEDSTENHSDHSMPVVTPRFSTQIRRCLFCGQLHRKLWRLPCGHYFCRHCLVKIVDEGFRDIEGLDGSPCPRCRNDIRPSSSL